jgi:hypothetical protein
VLAIIADHATAEYQAHSPLALPAALNGLRRKVLGGQAQCVTYGGPKKNATVDVTQAMFCPG